MSTSSSSISSTPLLLPPPNPQPRYSLWDLKELTLYTQDWIQHAKIQQVNITKQIEGITYAITNAPPIIQNNKVNEIILVQQMVVRGMYCSQIIREITKQRILKLAQQGISEMENKAALIESCKNWALNNLPPEIFLGSPKTMAERCRQLDDRIEEMKDKILQK